MGNVKRWNVFGGRRPPDRPSVAGGQLRNPYLLQGTRPPAGKKQGAGGIRPGRLDDAVLLRHRRGNRPERKRHRLLRPRATSARGRKPWPSPPTTIPRPSPRRSTTSGPMPTRSPGRSTFLPGDEPPGRSRTSSISPCRRKARRSSATPISCPSNEASRRAGSSEFLIEKLIFLSGIASIVFVALIFLFLLREGISVLKSTSLGSFLGGQFWYPDLQPAAARHPPADPRLAARDRRSGRDRRAPRGSPPPSISPKSPRSGSGHPQVLRRGPGGHPLGRPRLPRHHRSWSPS